MFIFITQNENVAIAILLPAGVFEDRRLIIVITQFDLMLEPDSTDEEITVEKVQELVCQSVREACPDAKISFDDVLPLSGVWAYRARMLAKSRPDEPNYSTTREVVVRYLSNYQSSPCGQGESPSLCLSIQNDDHLVEKLLGISRIASLEERYTLAVCILNFNFVHNIIVKMVIESDL